MDKWNRIYLPPPPLLTETYPQEGRNNVVDESVVSLTSQISNLNSFMAGIVIDKLFGIDLAILTSMHKQYATYRATKFYGLIAKVLKCIKHLKAMGLRKFVRKLQKLMPSVYHREMSFSLPARETFEYLLTRIYGAFKVLLTLESSCCEAAYHLLTKINYGHVYQISLVYLAGVARLRTLAINYADQLASTYDGILPCIECLKGRASFTMYEKNSSCLFYELESHFRAKKKQQRYPELARNASRTEESSILDTFADVEDSGLEDSLLTLLNTTVEDHASGAEGDVQDERISGEDDAPPGGIISAMAKISDLNPLVPRAGNSLKEKEDLLSLLDIFDDVDVSSTERASETVGGRSDFSHTCSDAVVASITSGEDIGESIEIGLSGMLGKQSVKLTSGEDIGESIEIGQSGRRKQSVKGKNSNNAEIKAKEKNSDKKKKKFRKVETVESRCLDAEKKTLKKGKLKKSSHVDEEKTVNECQANKSKCIYDNDEKSVKKSKLKKRKSLDDGESVVNGEHVVKKSKTKKRKSLDNGEILKSSKTKKRKSLDGESPAEKNKPKKRKSLDDGEIVNSKTKKRKSLDNGETVKKSKPKKRKSLDDGENAVIKSKPKESRCSPDGKLAIKESEMVESNCSDEVLKLVKKKKVKETRYHDDDKSSEAAEAAVAVNGLVISERKKKKIEMNEDSKVKESRNPDDDKSSEAAVAANGLVIKEKKKKKKKIKNNDVSCSGDGKTVVEKSREKETNDVKSKEVADALNVLVISEGKKKKKKKNYSCLVGEDMDVANGLEMIKRKKKKSLDGKTLVRKSKSK